jgi:two-component system response regulator FixJ
MSSEPVIHIIDDDDAMRDSLAFLLESADFTTKTYDSALAFLDALPQAERGCIVTDVRMPEMNGIELVRRLKALDAPDPVIVITGHADVSLAVEAMKAGAVDFIEKPFDDELLLSTIRSALAGRSDPRSAERAEIQERIDLLSGREREVLAGLVAGRPNKIIAYHLGISPRTVEVYRANLMTKMQAGSLSELVRMALLCGVGA